MDDDEGHEENGEEEDEFSDDDILDVRGDGSASSSNPTPKTSKKAPNDNDVAKLPTPCRRFTRKGSSDMDDVQIISTGKSKERLELDRVLEMVQALQLSQ